MKPLRRFAFLALIPLGCATAENTLPDGNNVGPSTAGSAGSGETAGSAGTTTETGGTAPGAGTGTQAGSNNGGGSGLGGTNTGTAGTAAGTTSGGTFGTGGGGTSAGGSAGASSTAGTAGTAGKASGGAGGTAGANGTAGTAGKASGGAGGTAGTSTTAGTGGAAGTAGTSSTAGTAGTATGTDYCDTHAKSALPFTVNVGFQPSGWQGDATAITALPTNQAPCTTRPAGAVGNCTAWRFTPNAQAPAWSGVSWATYWDASYTHDPVCLATGATKVTFQARGQNGGEKVTFSAAGGPELEFTLTTGWQAFSIPLTGIQYNTPAAGVTSGFFWKVAPPTPAGAPVTFYVDDIQFEK